MPPPYQHRPCPYTDIGVAYSHLPPAYTLKLTARHLDDPRRIMPPARLARRREAGRRVVRVPALLKKPVRSFAVERGAGSCVMSQMERRGCYMSAMALAWLASTVFSAFPLALSSQQLQGVVLQLPRARLRKFFNITILASHESCEY
ncbi:hypothetical protein C8J57DRAFT_1513714 [Mycena rebaudengoi]|nr:hypothetical protein C8J57DRAFT_1513714 [Mycena rebaudengoi]